VAVCVLVGAVLLAAPSGAAAAGWLEGDVPRAVAVFALVGAAGWQLTPGKRRALYACHRAAPLAAAGWRADRDCVSYGLSIGSSCVRNETVGP
jgi:hypothetical protein